MWLYLTERTDFFRHRHRVLHTAPEPCFEQRFRAAHGRRYVSVDAFDPAADVQADLTDLPFAGDSFDVILSSHVLEHVEEDARAMAELARVLKPTGWALILVPYDAKAPTREDRTLNTPALRMAAYGHPYHYRIYGTDITERLQAAGLRARIISTNQFLSGHRKRRYRINRNYMVLCRKA
jgi:SAM-dependent methyltransferase